MQMWPARHEAMEPAFRIVPTVAPPNAPLPTMNASMDGELVSQRGRTIATWDRTHEIEPRQELVFSALMEGRANSPVGVYELRFFPPAGSALPIRSELDAPLVRFELRDVQTTADETELLRRRMMAAYFRANLEEMQAESGNLLQRYPFSSAAYRNEGRNRATPRSTQ